MFFANISLVALEPLVAFQIRNAGKEPITYFKTQCDVQRVMSGESCDAQIVPKKSIRKSQLAGAVLEPSVAISTTQGTLKLVVRGNKLDIMGCSSKRSVSSKSVSLDAVQGRTLSVDGIEFKLL